MGVVGEKAGVGGGHPPKNLILFREARELLQGDPHGFVRQAAPIKFGLLTDMVIPKTPERDVWEDMIRPFELVFRDGSSRASSTARWSS